MTFKIVRSNDAPQDFGSMLMTPVQHRWRAEAARSVGDEALALHHEQLAAAIERRVEEQLDREPY